MIRKTGLFLVVLFSITVLSPLSAQNTTGSYNQLAKERYEKRDYDGVISAATLSLNVNANGEAYWWRALGYKNKRNYEIAVSDFTQALGYYTNNKSSSGTICSLRGDCYFEMKDYSKAADDYERVLFKFDYSDKKRIHWNLAKSLYEIEEYEDAIENYSKAISLYTSAVDLSILYQEMADIKSLFIDYSRNEIIGDYSKSIQKNNQNAKAYYNRALLYFDLRKYDSSLMDFTSAIQLYEAQGAVKYARELGICYGSVASIKHYNGNITEAKTDYLTAIRVDTNNGALYWQFAVFLSNTNRRDPSATEYFQKALTYLSSKKDKTNCYLDLYLHERSSLRYNAAIKALDAAIQLDPANANYYWDKAYVYSQKKDYASSLLYYDKAIGSGVKDSANRSRIYKARAEVKIKLNDLSGALFDFQKAIELQSGYDNFYALGKFFKQKLKQDELGNGNLQKSMMLALKTEKDTAINYVYAAAAMGDTKTAERLTRKLLVNASAKKNQFPNELHNAACIYTMIGNYNKALEYLDQSLAVGYNDYDHLLNDTDLEPLTTLPGYKAILEKYKVPQPVY